VKVGDLVKYRWWIDEAGSDGAPTVNPAKKKEQIGVLVSTGNTHANELMTEYVKVHFSAPTNAICDVPKFKLEVINASR